MNNVIVANLAKGRKVITAPVFQWNHGMVLRFINAQLPDNFRVDFSNSTRGVAKSQMGTPENGVVIPDEYFMPGGAIYAWIVESPTEHSAVARWEITIPLDPKSKWVDVQPTPQEENIIDEAIHALNEAVTDAQEAISHYPKVVDGYWYVWDVDSGEYVSTGINATGPAGSPGQDGQDGADGFSPTVTITDITNGHRVTVTDADGNHTFDVMDGEDGQNGAPGADGYSPTVTITDITGGHTVTITDKDGEHSFNVMDGETPTAPVTDVQINGTSIVENHIANILVATVEETQEIITNYGEDDSMTFEMEFVKAAGDKHYISVDDVSTIVAAFTAGKNVLIHFPENVTYSCEESYVKMIAYASGQYGTFIILADIGHNIVTTEAEIYNGKLKVPVYVD